MQVRCPHCHSPIEVVEEKLDDVGCPSCGSSFNLEGEEATISHQGEAGTKVAHYRLVEKLGMGAFGTVWKARDETLDRVVALKVPRAVHVEDGSDGGAEKFLREARAAAQLKHPGIVGVHEVGRDDGRVYIASDYVEGANLKEWLTAKRPTPREAAELCVKIAEALHHAAAKSNPPRETTSCRPAPGADQPFPRTRWSVRRAERVCRRRRGRASNWRRRKCGRSWRRGSGRRR